MSVVVIVTLSGGAGNQMRLYACAYSVARYLRQPLLLDVSDYFGGLSRPYVLDLLAIPDHIKIYYHHKKMMYGTPCDAPSDFFKEFECLINVENFNSRRELLLAVEGKKKVWIMGQSAVCFFADEEKDILKRRLQPEVRSRCLMDFMHKVGSRSVAVHVRRTDFLVLQWTNDETLKYYKAAISYLNQQIHGLEFYFFSDDIEWVKSNLGYNANYYYVDFLGGMKSDIDELFCMACCKHRVLTKYSSFGEWAVLFALQEGGINIINENVSNIPGMLVMDEQMIENCYHGYEADYETAEKKIPWDMLEQKLQANDNNGVIDYVSMASNNAYGISLDKKNRLMELNGIAHVQNNDANTAVSIFDYLQQTERESFDLSFNYSIALEKEACHMESLIYMGNAWRMNKDINPAHFLQVKNVWEENILKLVKEQKKKHYIFIDPPNPYARSIHGYYESIGIMLRNVGNAVTIIESIESSFTPLSSAEFGQEERRRIVETMLDFSKRLDSVYDFGINIYTFCELESLQEKVFTIGDFLPYIVKEDEDIIFITHSIEGLRNASGKYPIIFLDAISEWDLQKSNLNTCRNKDWNEIYHRAEMVITKKVFPEEWKEKSVMPFVCMHVTKSDEVCFVKEKITKLSHYMRNEECLSGMLSILKAVKMIETK